MNLLLLIYKRNTKLFSLTTFSNSSSISSFSGTAVVTAIAKHNPTKAKTSLRCIVKNVPCWTIVTTRLMGMVFAQNSHIYMYTMVLKLVVTKYALAMFVSYKHHEFIFQSDTVVILTCLKDRLSLFFPICITMFDVY